ncbi:MAG: PQQ-binding-like beta-propeller repeat protein [Ignavibacteriales bacterium]|nr:PQQ-binding-like beta-propeller repeat protein [Ignavibacteriales bacterium]
MKYFILCVILATHLFSQSNFRFVHLSDTHIGSATGAEDLRRTVNDINTLGDISFVLITGDITEFGSDDQFRLAKQILDSLKIPWHIVPGNHDMKWSESGGTSFAAIFGSERFVFDFGRYKFIGMHQGPRMRMGDAYWTNEDTVWLDSILSAMPDSRQRFFIATHYPADSGIANWYRVTYIVRRYNIQAFLNGHWHRNYFDLFDGIPSVVGRSNLRGRDSIGGYNIVEIRNDSMIYSTRIAGCKMGILWAVVPLGERIYLSMQTPRSNISSDHRDKSPNVKIVWKNTYSSSMPAPPVLTKKYRLQAYLDGTVRMHNITEDEYSTITVKGSIVASPASDDVRIVIPSTDSNIYCYSIASQKLLWKFKTGAAVVAPPVIEDGVAYCGASDRKFRALEVRSGKLKWSFDSLRGHVEVRPLITHGKVIFGAWDEYLYCLDQSTGQLLWKWKGDKPGTLLSPAACEPVHGHGKIFVVAPDRYMTAIDLNTGNQIWRTNQFKVRETIGMSEDGERVYIRTMNDSLYALSTKAIQPEVIWSLNAGFGYDINSSQLREKEGVLFCTTKNGLLIAVDAKTGEVLWKFKEDVVIAHTPIPISKNRVIFSNVTGTVCEIIAQHEK